MTHPIQFYNSHTHKLAVYIFPGFPCFVILVQFKHLYISIYYFCLLLLYFGAETFWCRNVSGVHVFRGLVSNCLHTETSGAPGLGPKSQVTKTTWSQKVSKSSAMSHFRLGVSALSPDGRLIWPHKTSHFCPESFWPQVISV